MTELELHPQYLPAVPSPGEFELILRQADVISRSGIVPTAYRSTVSGDGRILQDKRANVVVATLTGRTFGWDAITAMRNIHVIEGAASLKPEAQLGLIRRAGHKVRIVRKPREVTVTGTRADDPDNPLEVTFSFEDGVRAGLCTLTAEGQPRARSKDGKPLPWEQYPVDMCQWRAVGAVARGLFSDIVLGLGYTPEELGAIVDAEGEVIIESAPMPDPAQHAAAAEEEPRAAVETGYDGDAASNSYEPPTEEHVREEARADIAEARRTAEEPRELTAEQEVERAQQARARRNLARRGPATMQAQARARDALVDLYPDWTDDERKAEAVDELAKLGAQPGQTVTLEQWNQLAENLERAKDDGIRKRHERVGR